jgi:hypothetical protein
MGPEPEALRDAGLFSGAELTPLADVTSLVEGRGKRSPSEFGREL